MVLLMRGLLSNSLSLLVGQSCIQWPLRHVQLGDPCIIQKSANLFDRSGSIHNLEVMVGLNEVEMCAVFRLD